MRERRPEVCLLGLEVLEASVDPLEGVRPVWVPLLRKSDKIGGVGIARGHQLARRQSLQPELANGLQHQETRLPARTVLLAQQAAGDEGGDALQYIDPTARQRRSGFQGASAHKDGQTTKEELLL